MTKQPLRVGVGGPVGSGKTALMEQLCKRLCEKLDIAAITNDIYTQGGRANSVARTCCRPIACRRRDRRLSAYRDPRGRLDQHGGGRRDAEAHPDLELIFIEIGGDNLSATFSPELVDLTIYVIDVAEGDKIPRKGGPGIPHGPAAHQQDGTRPTCRGDLDVMARDATTQRKSRPFVMTNMKTGEGVDTVIAFLSDKGGLKIA